jgi:L-asparaginase II
MRLARVRSGLSESFDDVAVIALDSDGNTLFSSGVVDQPMFYRSAIKPFQAIASRRFGLDLPAEHLALACASHGGYPTHLALVGQIMDDHGYTAADLRCTPGRPLALEADRYQASLGRIAPERIFHNCSGKHAGWLAACAVADLDPHTYLDPHHPLQAASVDTVREYSGADPRPVGVDGCGAPTLRGTVRNLATAFARLTTEPEAQPVATAMTSYGALVADNVRPDGKLATTWGGPVKVGAEGSIAMARNGVAIAAKSNSGTSDMAVSGALHAAQIVGILANSMANGLSDEISPPVFGGGRRVGRTIVVEES